MTYVMLGKRFTQEEWEAVCNRCGLCCYEKYEEAGRVVFTNTPCRYLSAENTCKVYAHRFHACDDCHAVTPGVVLQGDILPPECSYVQLAKQLSEELAERSAVKEAPATRGRWYGRRRRSTVTGDEEPRELSMRILRFPV